MGERTAENLQAHKPFARLTFNPYFDKLAMHISSFIKDIESAAQWVSLATAGLIK